MLLMMRLPICLALLLVLSPLLFVPPTDGQAACPDRTFRQICGDCWCGYDPAQGETCPEFTSGYHDGFAPDFYEKYESFNLTTPNNQLPQLVSESGGECYPFANTVGSIANYPESNLPQCVYPPMWNVSGAVCAFKYEGSEPANETACVGRNYELITYESRDAAEADGAEVTHVGACGVCSNAFDLSVYMKNLLTMQETSAICAGIYSFGIFSANNDEQRRNEYEKLIRCFQGLEGQNIGLTRTCSTLWAHSVAVTGSKCAAACTDNVEQNAAFNGQPPQCVPLGCLTCRDDNTQGPFEAISGRTYQNSGIVQTVVYPCRDFASVIHEPCGGILGCRTLPPSPTPRATSDAIRLVSERRASLAVVIGVVSGILWTLSL